MANLCEIVGETKVVTGSENWVDEPGSIWEENRKDDDNGVVETEIGMESIFEESLGLGLANEAKIALESLSSVNGVLGRDFSYSKNEGFDSKKSEECVRIGFNVKGCGNGYGRWNGEKLQGDHGFRVGDLVWGKVRSYPWWPGQIYDPQDASDFAVKHSREGCLLVAFFGDRSCSWCLPSQLVPFVENFSQMSKDGASKGVVNAVQKSLNELGRLVESKMTCKCVRNRGHLVRPIVANAGVKAGVLVPHFDINRVTIPEFTPSDMLTRVVSFAKGVSVDNVFELGILKSTLSAFYNAKYGRTLAVHEGPMYIEGLEDKDEGKKPIARDNILSMEVPVDRRPQDEDDGGKQRSVAELMQKRNDRKRKPKRKTKSVNGPYLKRHKAADGEIEGPRSTMKSGSLKRAVDAESENEKPKKITPNDAKEEIENATSPRERKLSKYLCPPFVDYRVINLSYSKTKPELKSFTRSSSPVSEPEGSNETSGLMVDNGKRLSFPVSDVNIPLNELLYHIEVAAVDPFFLRRNGSLDKVWGFVSAFRGSMYVDGSDYRVYQKSVGNECEDLISDISLIKDKLDIMTAMLEDTCSKISSEEKRRLRDEMKNLMDHVETTSRKVRLVAETSSF